MDLESLFTTVGSFAPPALIALLSVGYGLGLVASMTGEKKRKGFEMFREYLANEGDDEEIEEQIPTLMVR